MEEENTTFDYSPDADANVDAPAVDGAVSESKPEPETFTLNEIKEYLGKDFKDKATALKSIKDTFGYVGKRKEDIAKEVAGSNDTIASELKQLKENIFYKDNPDYAQYKDLISKMGTNPEDVVQSKEFKNIFDKAKGFDESQKLKSVLQSNPRIAATKDSLTKAQEAAKAGNNEERDKLIAQAVLATLE